MEGSTRTERAAAPRALHRPVPAARRRDARRGRPHRRLVRLREGRREDGGGDGFADVWKRGHFAWEYKGKHKNLTAAYHQLLEYREDLENPPLLVVCDLDRFEVHTNFTDTPTTVYAFDLDDLARPREPCASSVRCSPTRRSCVRSAPDS